MKNTSSSSCAVADEMQLASSNPEKSRRWRSTARQASDAHPALEPGEQHGVVVAMGLTEERGSANTAASLTRNSEKGRGGGVFARPNFTRRVSPTRTNPAQGGGELIVGYPFPPEVWRRNLLDT